MICELLLGPEGRGKTARTGDRCEGAPKFSSRGWRQRFASRGARNSQPPGFRLPAEESVVGRLDLGRRRRWEELSSFGRSLSLILHCRKRRGRSAEIEVIGESGWETARDTVSGDRTTVDRQGALCWSAFGGLDRRRLTLPAEGLLLYFSQLTCVTGK